MKEARHQVVPSVYLVAIRDNKILLGERQNTGYCDGYLGLPAGHIERGENPLQAIMREAKEEVDLTLTVEEIKFGAVMPRITPDRECVDYFFIADVTGKNLQNNEPTKCKFWELLATS